MVASTEPIIRELWGGTVNVLVVVIAKACNKLEGNTVSQIRCIYVVLCVGSPRHRYHLSSRPERYVSLEVVAATPWEFRTDQLPANEGSRILPKSTYAYKSLDNLPEHAATHRSITQLS